MKKLLLISVLFLGTFFFAEDAFATANVYYSVGQSSSNLLAGTSVTVTLTSGAAVFNVAQTGNIGVGDRVTYDSDNKVAFIAAKTNADQKHWTLITATGGTPADVSAVAVGSIKHEYTSLSTAVAGAYDANHIGNSDLTTADAVLNIPCYYDSGADTSAVTVSGYTTDATRYIKIYTPDNTSTEANNSQRHQGKWDAGKYRLEVSGGYTLAIRNYVSYTTFDGLQVKITYGSGVSRAFLVSGGSINLSNSIIVGSPSADVSGYGIDLSSGSGYLWNNIIYNFKSASNYGTGIYGLYNGYAFNNTVVYCGIGIYGNYKALVIKNNISYNNNNNYSVNSSWAAGCTNNLSGPGTDADIPVTSKRDGVIVSFVDATNKDFHLSLADTGAKDYGTDLSGTFTTDIDATTRPIGAQWDIGADEMIYLESQFRGYVNMKGNVNVR